MVFLLYMVFAVPNATVRCNRVCAVLTLHRACSRKKQGTHSNVSPVYYVVVKLITGCHLYAGHVG